LGHGRLVIDAAAGDIDQHHARLELADLIRADDAAGGLVEWNVDGDDVGRLDDGVRLQPG